MLQHMEFHASHIYIEGNVLVDIMSNVALAYDEFTWWSHDILAIRGALINYLMGKFMYRFD